MGILWARITAYCIWEEIALTKVLVNGAAGRMGRAVLKAVIDDADLELVGAVDITGGADAGELAGTAKNGICVETDLAAALEGMQVPAHHDADASAFGYAIGQIPQMPPRFDSDATLIEHAEHAATVFDGAAVHHGLIVSGDQFINSADKIATIRTHFPDAMAVEMEAAAIAQTSYHFSRPCVIIRAISDLADGEAEYSFEQFLQTASVHSAEMVENIVRRI